MINLSQFSFIFSILVAATYCSIASLNFCCCDNVLPKLYMEIVDLGFASNALR